ncbi:Peptidase family M13 [Aphelenchoides besseyi]|nr:Peptidase family M13 [Aphelenchoides besseyi]
MASCVISQYSEQCCPLKSGNVHCANGVETQGKLSRSENIADLGGQLAAYNAYRRWVAESRNGVEEDRLPGLEGYTANQIFWISYGFSWCMNQNYISLSNQLLTNEHAPGSCRVNQVMQDIPAFAKDFGCKPKSPMFPPAEQRCKVWTGV